MPKSKPTQLPGRPLFRRSWQGRQDINLELIHTIHGRHVRAKVTRDSYDFQSHANAYTLTPAGGWELLISIPYPAMAALAADHAALDVERQLTWLEQDARALLELADTLLQPIATPEINIKNLLVDFLRFIVVHNQGKYEICMQHPADDKGNNIWVPIHHPTLPALARQFLEHTGKSIQPAPPAPAPFNLGLVDLFPDESTQAFLEWARTATDTAIAAQIIRDTLHLIAQDSDYWRELQNLLGPTRTRNVGYLLQQWEIEIQLTDPTTWPAQPEGTTPR